ncbi:MAG: hypothetical protein K2W85_00175 [Phycisphaerales bacterium]|nr:hypothetical protein [Phycisphaerales bacterium]
MNVSSAQLLKMLGSGVLPPGVSTPPKTGVEQASFADLLNRAREGTLGSAQPVTIGDNAGVTLNDEQLARLSLAADQLESSGVRTALINIDGQKLIMDVSQREISGVAPASGPVPGIDGMIDLGDARTPASIALPGAPTPPIGTVQPSGPNLQPPSTIPQNSTLLQLLADL